MGVLALMCVDDIASFEPLWHPRDAAAYLGLHEKTVIKMARLRQLPALRLGKHWRFRSMDLAGWVASTIQSTSQPTE
jgi:excisionase family DNA binding protein